MPISLLLRCKDIAETRRFYADVLGVPVTSGAEGTVTAHVFGELIFTEADLWKVPSGLSGTIYFAVPDVDRLHAQVSARTPIAWGLETMSYGSREFAVVDCNGYYVAFRQAG